MHTHSLHVRVHARVPGAGLNVEEKIQLAMAQGDFDNLRGKGQPLERYSDGPSIAIVAIAMCSNPSFGGFLFFA